MVSDWILTVSLSISLDPGQLVDFIKRIEVKGSMSCDTVLKIFYQSCRAVQHMHKQKPPIIHRDLKVSMKQLCRLSLSAPLQ